MHVVKKEFFLIGQNCNVVCGCVGENHKINTKF